jgi:hypothetical protein
MRGVEAGPGADSMTTYSELRLRIDRGPGHGSYRIEATGPSGDALGRFKLPFSGIELENFVLKVGSTRRGRRRVDSPEMELARTFGTKLFGALFEGDVRELYRSSFAEARIAGRGLRISLSLTSTPELMQVPWEYLYDQPSFLSISTWTPIVRYLDLPKPRRALRIELPLRILALVSAPDDAEPIDGKQERSKLEAALAPLIGSGAIMIDWLEEASLRALQHQVRKADYHVFHYIGHGGYDQVADDGVLLFEDEHGHGRRVSGVELGTILADEVSLRLAVLNSCEGARSSLQDPFSGVATSLIEREIPAVIGMQFEITDRAAIVFAGEFYSALADGLSVDSALAEARKAIYADQNDIEWGTPVLFMRVADGRLFDVAPHSAVRPLRPQHAAEPDEEPLAAEKAEQLDTERAKPAREPIEPDDTAQDAAAPAEPSGSKAEAVAGAAADSGRSGARPVPGMAGEANTGIAPAASIREPDTTPADLAEREAKDIWPGLPRTAGRAALGGVLTITFADAWILATHLDSLNDAINQVAGLFISLVALTALAMVAAVMLAEGLWPAIRVPGGRAYRPVGGNRWAATAVQGAVTGATVGLAVVAVVDGDLFTLETALVLAVAAASGFMIAEALLGRLSLRRRGRSAPA